MLQKEVVLKHNNIDVQNLVNIYKTIFDPWNQNRFKVKLL